MNYKTAEENSVLEKPRSESRLFYFDREMARKNPERLLIGVDEAGRGPLAGPVVACAAWLPLSAAEQLGEADDSKKLTEKKRLELFKKMVSLGVRFGFAYSAPEEIDRLNILNATFKAMREASAMLAKHLDGGLGKALVMVDGPHRIRNFEVSQVPIVDGDAKSLSIACASVFAKVIRDKWMKILDLQYPQYGFALHKGYGTKAHMEKLTVHGASPEHRKSFAPVRDVLCVR
ncbi:MAG: ribonuclease HII [Elusimicrobia bacterium CG08_land_8_20_14_0_20_51_18]|nr:MAG: ribonuclease HII [Elusimicrobia bacterium CG08_land_8_20_14_0_20_51_18]